MTLQSVPRIYRPTRRVSPLRVRCGPMTWRSDSPVSDWWAEWRPAVSGLARFLLATLIFGIAGWAIATWMIQAIL